MANEFARKKCIVNGCKNLIHVHSYWEICIDCYGNVPNHIPLNQANLYSTLKRDKENGDNTCGDKW